MIASISAETFKNGMAKLAGAVTLITTDGPAGRAGFTATAVSSVTDTPPTLLVCINQKNETWEILKQNGVFAVSILPHNMEGLSNRFAGYEPITMAERFDQGTWQPLATGAPVLAEALACFDCEVSQQVLVGTHQVVFGRIVGAQVLGTAAQPLLYFNRKYRTLQES